MTNTKTIKTTEGSERKIIATAEEWKLIRDFTRYIKATKNKAAIQVVLGEVQTHSSCSHVIQNTWITECPICYGKKFHFIMSFEGDAAPGVFGGIKCCTCGFGAGTVMKKTPRFFSHQLLLDAIEAWSSKIDDILFDGKDYILKAWKADLLSGEEKAPPTIEKEKLLEYIDRALTLIEQGKE